MSRAVILSPHLDDAALSTWHVLGSGAQISVITVHTGVPAEGATPTRLDFLTGAQNPRARYLQRREEDRAVAARFGWEAIYLDLQDEPHRRSYPAMSRLVTRVAEMLPPDVDEIYVPAAIGAHQDHLLTRALGLGLRRVRPCRYALYAELPYATEFGWPAWVTGNDPSEYLDIDMYFSSSLRGMPVLEPKVHTLTDEMQALKVEAMKMYATQFPGLEAGPSRRLTHEQRLPYEITWDLGDDDVSAAHTDVLARRRTVKGALRRAKRVIQVAARGE